MNLVKLIDYKKSYNYEYLKLDYNVNKTKIVKRKKCHHQSLISISPILCFYFYLYYNKINIINYII